MANSDDVKLVVDKLTAVMAQGDECMGMVYDKPVAEWKEIFNAVAKQLNMPVYTVEALKSGDIMDVYNHMLELQSAFRASAGIPAIILVDTSGNKHVTSQELNMDMANMTEWMAKRYPKAVYIQVITEGTCVEPVCLYSMKPKVPHGPGPIMPV